MNYTTTEIWVIIIALGIGTYLIRFSFLGPLARMPMPPWAIRLLRYTPVAVIPGLVAPLVLWPVATDGQPDAARLIAAATALALGHFTKNVILAVLGGGAMLFLMLRLIGQA